MDQSFQLTELPGPVGLLTFDVPGKKVNTLSREVRTELANVLQGLSRRTDLRGLLLRSGKPGQFVAGADLKELAALASEPPEHTRNFLEQGHELLNRFGKLPFATVALVDGTALGGGTELALACDYRIASPAARFGLPETSLGMIPAWGGTQRMPRIIHWRKALEMILGGAPMSAEEALSRHLVSEVVAPAELVEAGRRLVERVSESGELPILRNTRHQPVTIDRHEFESATAAVVEEIRQQPGGRSAGRQAALEALRDGLPRPLEEGLAVELRVAGKVIGSPAAADLINEFFNSRPTQGKRA